MAFTTTNPIMDVIIFAMFWHNVITHLHARLQEIYITSSKYS